MSKMAPVILALLAIGIVMSPLANAQLTPRRTNSLFSSERPQPLSIDQAFPFFVSINNFNGLSITWEVADGHYLYKRQFGFSVKSTSATPAQVISFELPAGLKKTDQFFGDIEAYYTSVTATLDVNIDDISAATLIIEFQGCADWGFCYPPQVSEYLISP